MERFLWICLGGAAGSGARYLVALWAGQRFGSSFPYGTLIVNLAGCFAIAAVGVLLARLAPVALWPAIARHTPRARRYHVAGHLGRLADVILHQFVLIALGRGQAIDDLLSCGLAEQDPQGVALRLPARACGARADLYPQA